MSILPQKSLQRTKLQKEQRRISSAAFEFQGGLVKVKSFLPRLHVRSGLATRGVVRDFSRRSRKRMLEVMARLDWRKHKAIFLTLTYHNLIPNERDAKIQLRAFLKRLYRAYGHCAVLWRMEYQPGRGAVHFHLLAFDLPYVPKTEVLRLWQEVTGDATIIMTRIEMIRSPRQAMYYVGKYMAKIGQYHRGAIDLATGALAPDLVDLSFDHNWLDCETPGRFWGIEQRKNLPFAKLMTMLVRDAIEVLHDFKRLMRKKWRFTNKTRYRGATVFVNDAYQWYDALEFVIADVNS